MLRLVAPLLALLLLLLAPTGAAHTTVATADGNYLVTVGNLNEPVTTYTKTGLDLIIRANTSARPGIPGAQLTLQATLIAPNGDELSETLINQFGRPGAYTFERPYHLTMAGEYYLRLTGKINQTNVNFDRILVGSGAVPSFETTAFPDQVSSAKQLEERIAALEAEIAALKTGGTQAAAATSPGAGPLPILLVASLALTFLHARRRDAKD